MLLNCCLLLQERGQSAKDENLAFWLLSGASAVKSGLSSLTLSTLGKFSADIILKYFSYFS